MCIDVCHHGCKMNSLYAKQLKRLFGPQGRKLKDDMTVPFFELNLGKPANEKTTNLGVKGYVEYQQVTKTSNYAHVSIAPSARLSFGAKLVAHVSGSLRFHIVPGVIGAGGGPM